MVTTGASSLGEFLKENCTLKILNISNNPIGDTGISQLIKGLQQNNTLTELKVSMCGLSDKGLTCNSFYAIFIEVHTPFI